MRTIYLVPRGQPSPFAAWADPRPRAVIVESENEHEWRGRPAANPACPVLVYPKFAWEETDDIQ